MNKDVVAKINWFFDLASISPDSLSETDRDRWIRQTINTIILGIDHLDGERAKFPDKKRIKRMVSEWVEGKKFERCQLTLKLCIKKIMDYENFVEYLDADNPSNKDKMVEFIELYPVKKSMKMSLRYDFPAQIGKKGPSDRKITYMVDKPRLKKRPLRLVLSTGDEATDLIVEFLLLLKEAKFKLEYVKKCKATGCDNYFFHVTKRKKDYCSNKCAARTIGMKNRIELKKKINKDKYLELLEKKARKAREYYEKKVPFGKPGRRPWKYKDKKNTTED